MFIQYEKTFQGAHQFFAVDRLGNLVSMQYMYYSKAQALKLFKQFMKGQ
jgi:hypothetical protein